MFTHTVLIGLSELTKRTISALRFSCDASSSNSILEHISRLCEFALKPKRAS
ncbi:hypothetical protein POX_a00063 [Penicillium oxalicum]|uniref:hypothetical protein n=1 Tax=Penicillium oxalicum TaxID=69781 RepID=UPI0020B8D19A|nr:hypothetical protein POX_a00063 [Penicillium oxalicum]KAI2793483.1 hypothetical protein POX_a00063 [Penicillium oxalicum]